jgi:uncharacterized repeat protein (TIGR01451 family)
VTAGTNATYTITLTNNGPGAAQGATLSDVLPSGAAFVSLTPAAGNPDSFTFTQSGSTVAGSASGVGAGNTDTFTLVVSAPSSLANGANFSDTASVSSNSADPNPANNSATVTGSVVNTSPSADLAVADTGPATATEGGNVTYTITVTNRGPAGATGAVVTDTLGVNLRFVSATASQGTFSQSGGVVTFNLGSIASAGTATVTVTAQALEDGNLSNAASVSGSSADPNPANNSAGATTAVAEASIVVSAPFTTTSSRLNSVTVATFTHANGVEPAGAFTATINWGDGQTSRGTITLSGTTYSVTGSHRYQTRGSHTITTTVTEVSSATQLLLAKIGDEVPALPDRVRTGGGRGRFSPNIPSNPAAPPAAGDAADSGVLRQEVNARSQGLFEPGKKESLARDRWGMLLSLRTREASSPDAAEPWRLIDELTATEGSS